MSKQQTMRRRNVFWSQRKNVQKYTPRSLKNGQITIFQWWISCSNLFYLWVFSALLIKIKIKNCKIFLNVERFSTSMAILKPLGWDSPRSL
jgi:hypothetical protein